MSPRIATLLCVALAACTNDRAADSASLALTGLAVVDVETGTIARDQTILIDGSTIRSVTSAADAAAGIGDGTLVVDHAHRYAIPGLWDMHVRFRTGPTPDVPRATMVEENRSLLPQYVGFGITAVRDAGGDLPDEVLAWRKQIETGTLIGPRIFTALRKISGPYPPQGTMSVSWQGAMPVASAAEMEAAIDALLAAGADFIKFHEEGMDPQVMFAGLAAAEARGALTAAHVPFHVPLEDVLGSGLDSIEHMETLLKAAHPDDRAFSAEVSSAIATGRTMPYLLRLAENVELERARPMLRRIASSGIAISPTLYAPSTAMRIVDARAHDDDERLKQVPPGIRASYARRVATLVARTPEVAKRQIELRAAADDIVGLAAAEGATVLAGSDNGAGNSYAYPGDSLHAELAELVANGLSPLQALQAATINGAKWFRADDRYGTIAAGKAADIVILEANPLDDIARTLAMAGVALNGAYFDAAQLEALRTLAEQAARR